MAYVSNDLMLLQSGFAGKGQEWSYDSTDAATVVRANGYISDGKAKGMKVGDIVRQRDSVGATIAHDYVVNAVNADGSVDLTDGTATPGLTDTN